MKFRDFITEKAKETHAVLAFGRMNPPTTGHEVLVKKVHDVAKEVCAMWLRKNNYADFDTKTIEKLTVNLKKLAPGKTIHTAGGNIAVSQKDFVFNSSQKD